VCGLRWSDLDSDARTLSIKRSIASVPGGTIVKDTKSHAARRISLDDDTIAILELQRDRVKHRAEVCQLAFNDDGYVFTATADGRCLSDGSRDQVVQQRVHQPFAARARPTRSRVRVAATQWLRSGHQCARSRLPRADHFRSQQLARHADRQLCTQALLNVSQGCLPTCDLGCVL
jgi:integrase